MTESIRRAIIDIGSNSIRLVVFGGSARAPVVLYNEKLMAGLGRGVIETGRLAEESVAAALAGLKRFQVLVDAMDVASLDVVATAAVRDAADGARFVGQIRALGLPVRLLSGDDEASASGYGVVSAIPDADGIVADLGGGSLELVRVRGGAIFDRVSLPLGILKVPMIEASDADALSRHVATLVAQSPWVSTCQGLPLYLVGGSWRSLARVHMHQNGFPLPVLSEYRMPTADLAPLATAVASMDRNALKQIPSMPSARIPMINDSAALLAALSQAINPSHLITCAFGLREGLLYQALTPEQRALDPLLEGVRFATGLQQQVPGYGDALMRWLDGLFGDEGPAFSRLRYAVCMLRGTGWASNPDFRALGGEELALHGNWSGVDARDRAIMAMALFVGFGGSGGAPKILSLLADTESLDHARAWGLAIRLAQRLSGGAPDILDQCGLTGEGGKLSLALPKALASLQDETLSRRLDALAGLLNLAPESVISSASGHGKSRNAA